MIMSSLSVIGRTHSHPCLVLLLPMLTETQCVATKSVRMPNIHNLVTNYERVQPFPSMVLDSHVYNEDHTDSKTGNDKLCVERHRTITSSGSRRSKPLPAFPLCTYSSILMPFITKIHPHAPPPKPI